MSIYVTGDTHGIYPCGYLGLDGFKQRLSAEWFPEQHSLTKDDYVIICGDFGAVWNTFGESDEEKDALDWLEQKSFTTLFVPGNHENYDRLTGLRDVSLLDSWLYNSLSEAEKRNLLNGYSQRYWNGGMVRELRPSVLMLENGYIFNIDGYKCFAFGGAKSHDIGDGILEPLSVSSNEEMQAKYNDWTAEGKKFRVHHVSWWEQEMPSNEDMKRGLDNLESAEFDIDFIFSHDASTSTKKEIMGDNATPDKLTDFFEDIKKKTSYKKWYFGHLHQNKVFSNGKDEMVYEKILKIN